MFCVTSWLSVPGHITCKLCHQQMTYKRWPVLGICGHSICVECYDVTMHNDLRITSRMVECPLPACARPGSFDTVEYRKNHACLDAIREMDEVCKEATRYKDRIWRSFLNDKLELNKLVKAMTANRDHLRRELVRTKIKIREERTLPARKKSYLDVGVGGYSSSSDSE